MYSWRNRTTIITLSVVVAVAGAVASCSSDESDPGALTPSGETPNSPNLSKVKHDPLHQLGKGLALALADGSIRSWVHGQIKQSPFVEWRVPLREVLQTESRSAHVGKLLSRAALTTDEVGGLASLELYFPYAEHRTKWSGGSDIQVAVQVGRSGSYAVYNSSGGVKIVGEKAKPAIPTLVLGPSEIEYADAESAIRGGSRTGEVISKSPPARLSQRFTPRMMFASVGTSSIWDLTDAVSLGAFEIYVRHDGGLAGDDEIEMFGWNTHAGSATPIFYADCTRYTGVNTTFTWHNVNPNDPVNYLTQAEPVAGTNERLNLRMAEDDNGACVYVSGDDDWMGSKAELTGPWSGNIITMERPIGTTGHGAMKIHTVDRN